MIAGAYVNLLRSIPLVMVIFWFFFLMPDIGAVDRPAARSRSRSAHCYSAIITFTLFEAAYYCEIMRAGIQSVPRGQVSAGYALGLTYWQPCDRAAAGVPQHAAGAADADDHPVPGHVAGLRDRRHRFPRRGFEGRAARLAGRSRCTCSSPLVYFVICFALSMLVRQLQKKIAIIR